MKHLFASLLLLAACAPSQARVEAPRPALDRIELRISSWGKIYSDWRIAPDGTGVYTHADGPGLGTRLVTRKIDAGPQGFARIRALLAPAERAAGAKMECGERWTDFPYGSASWIAGPSKVSTVSTVFDLGCKNPALKPIHDAVGNANKQMESWSKAGAILEDKEMNP